MKGRASIGRAAAELGVSIDALRDYEEQGLISPERTPGGHRRYRREDLAQLKRNRQLGWGTPEPAVDHSSQKATARPARRVQASPTDDRTIDDINPLEKARRRHVPERPSIPVLPVPATNQLARLQANIERTADDNHLRMLRSHGEYHIPWGASPSARSAVIEMLASYVSLARFPRSESPWDARRAIEAKVDATLEPFLEAATRAAAAAKEQAHQAERLKALMDRGTTRARSATLSWHADDRRQAEAAITDIMADEVEADWREDEVDELVDEILDEWAEDDDA